MPVAVILTALPVEYDAVRSYLSDLQEETKEPEGKIYQRGKFVANGQIWEVGIAEVGAGNTGAAVEVVMAISYFHPDILLFVGIAGGIKDVKIGDVVAATKVYGYESGKAGEQFLPRPELGKSTYKLVERARAEKGKKEWLQRLSNTPVSPPPRVFVAPIAAGEKVIASKQSDIFRFLRTNYNDAIAVEMEGFGFLSAAFAHPNIQAIVIRGISDLIEGKNDDSQEPEEVRQDKAAHHASAFAFEILAKFSIQEKGKSSSQQFTLPLHLPESNQTMNSDSTPLKVFISYTHDSSEHKDRVLEVADRLREDGIDCIIDQYEESPFEGWQRWMLNQIEIANFVLVVCTEQYNLRFLGQEEFGKGKGAVWEGGVIIQELYDAQGKNSKFIPITFSSKDSSSIPKPLCSATYYNLDREDGYDLLYRRLTNQHSNRKPKIGKLRTLLPRERKQNFLNKGDKPGDVPESFSEPLLEYIAQKQAEISQIDRRLEADISSDLKEILRFLSNNLSNLAQRIVRGALEDCPNLKRAIKSNCNLEKRINWEFEKYIENIHNSLLTKNQELLDQPPISPFIIKEGTLFTSEERETFKSEEGKFYTLAFEKLKEAIPERYSEEVKSAMIGYINTLRRNLPK